MTPIILDPPDPAQVGTSLALDPVEVATGRVEVALNLGAIRVGPAGPDWGDALIEQYLAEQARGQTPVDFRVPNRQITIPLILGASGAGGFAQARSDLMAKVALIQREGGWIRRSTGLYADVVNASLKLPDRYSHLGVEADVILTLEALPDFYGDEITLADQVATTSAELVFTHTGIEGDYPGRVRIGVDNDEAVPQLGLIWAFRCRHYSAAVTARLAYEAEDMTPLDAAGVTSNPQASGGDEVVHASIAQIWTPVLSTDLLSGGPLTHTGTYRLWVRALSYSEVPPRVRFVWDVGDLTHPTENDPVSFPGYGYHHDLDLGEVRLDPAPVGVHRWRGQIQAIASIAGWDHVAIDKVWLVPVDDGYGVLRASLSPTTGLATFSARDEFNQSAGNLTGKTLPVPVGGTWAGAGDADDFTMNLAEAAAQRTATSDTGVGRVAIAGTTTFTDIACQVDVHTPGLPASGFQHYGIVARYVDINNHLIAVIHYPGAGADRIVTVTKLVAGAPTTLRDAAYSFNANVTHRLWLMVLANGVWVLWARAGDQPGEPVLSGYDPDLATGGPLATGKVGLTDYAGGASTRYYDNFAAWVPTGDAVLFGNQSAELRTDGMHREDTAGDAYGPVSHVTGALPRIPPSGLEERTVEVFLKASRGDLRQIPDLQVDDDISARVFYRPCYLFPTIT